MKIVLTLNAGRTYYDKQTFRSKVSIELDDVVSANIFPDNSTPTRLKTTSFLPTAFQQIRLKKILTECFQMGLDNRP